MSQPPGQSPLPNTSDEAARLFALANQLRDSGHIEEAIGVYQQVLAISPEHVAAQMNLGTAHAMRGRWEPAAAAYRRAVALRPDIPELQFNLGNALESNCQWQEALAPYKQAIRLRPTDPGFHDHLGVVLRYLGRLDEAEAAHRQALQLAPDYASAHCNLANISQLRGDLRHAWPENEWRLRFPDPGRAHPRFTGANYWDGRDPTGRTIILSTEGGDGDAIQFSRYAPLVAKRGARVMFRCQPPMARLFQSLEGVQQVITVGQPLPDFDLHCPVWSLPRIFDTSLETIPASVPYLQGDRQRAAEFKARLDAAPKTLNVGLVWAGGASSSHDRVRSMTLGDFAPLAKIPRARFFTLQKGQRAVQALRTPPGLELTDWTGDLNDWSDTAALLANLDLLITVDTAIAHLAGALGKPVWMLLQRIPDVRWMLDRSDSPWYPTMRLFRQERYFEWEKPNSEVVRALQERSDKMS